VSKITSNPWNMKDKAAWRQRQVVKRLYADEVLAPLTILASHFDVHQYGALSVNVERYPLLLARTPHWAATKKTILVTGGVHGYETSGVHGAIGMLELLQSPDASHFVREFNFLIAPCVSPWGYETINRWNPSALDPNRSFFADSQAEESRLLLDAMGEYSAEVFAHFDLHETTDTDNTVFRPALAARDGREYAEWEIPDGFYLVGDTMKPEDAFQAAIIARVQNVTHIAPADEQGRIIGEPCTQPGVINYATKKLGLCAGMTDAPFVTTTEVYPDSPNVTPQACIDAQVAAICGGVDFLLQNS